MMELYSTKEDNLSEDVPFPFVSFSLLEKIDLLINTYDIHGNK